MIRVASGTENRNGVRPLSALIYSHQRCGSSNALLFAAEFAPGGIGESEVFGRARLQKEFPGWRKRTYAQLAEYFTSVYDRSPVVKHLYGGHSADFDALILSNPRVDRIVLLRRDNRTAAALSALIARRTKEWHKSATEPLGPISTRQIRLMAENYAKAADLAELMCIRTGKPYVAVRYEDVFVDDVDDRIKRARQFLTDLYGDDFEIDEAIFAIAFNRHMASTRKVNSDETYQLVENIDEIFEVFPEIQS